MVYQVNLKAQVTRVQYLLHLVVIANLHCQSFAFDIDVPLSKAATCMGRPDCATGFGEGRLHCGLKSSAVGPWVAGEPCADVAFKAPALLHALQSCNNFRRWISHADLEQSVEISTVGCGCYRSASCSHVRAAAMRPKGPLGRAAG
eukprot:scaffold1912_cov332-Prasinococcus_capsulatus_cf.AAC.1